MRVRGHQCRYVIGMQTWVGSQVFAVCLVLLCHFERQWVYCQAAACENDEHRLLVRHCRRWLTILPQLNGNGEVVGDILVVQSDQGLMRELADDASHNTPSYT